jgi:hypothetical protein
LKLLRYFSCGKDDMCVARVWVDIFSFQYVKRALSFSLFAYLESSTNRGGAKTNKRLLLRQKRIAASKKH